MKLDEARAYFTAVTSRPCEHTSAALRLMFGLLDRVERKTGLDALLDAASGAVLRAFVAWHKRGFLEDRDSLRSYLDRGLKWAKTRKGAYKVVSSIVNGRPVCAAVRGLRMTMRQKQALVAAWNARAEFASYRFYIHKGGSVFRADRDRSGGRYVRVAVRGVSADNPVYERVQGMRFEPVEAQALAAQWNFEARAQPAPHRFRVMPVSRDPGRRYVACVDLLFPGIERFRRELSIERQSDEHDREFAFVEGAPWLEDSDSDSLEWGENDNS